MKPILFNSEMVRAILDGSKTQARRVLKQPFEIHANGFITKPRGDNRFSPYTPPYQVGDILYVQETWQDLSNNEGEYVYLADGNKGLADKDWGVITTEDIKWRPSIHMPQEAARIFLKVTDIRVERLQDITDADCWHEGLSEIDELYLEAERYRDGGVRIVEGSPERCAFARLWNSTIKKQDLDRYGWDANPWVWVIEFERVEVE